MLCTTSDTFHKKCTNKAGYNFTCNCSDTNKSFELQFITHLQLQGFPFCIDVLTFVQDEN